MVPLPPIRWRGKFHFEICRFEVMESARKRGVWFWLVVLDVGLAGLSVAESLVLKRIRAELLADEGISTRYAEGLEAPIVNNPLKFHFGCRKYSVWGLWSYKICLQTITFEGERRNSYTGELILGKCKSPFFDVVMYLPNSFFSDVEPEHFYSLALLQEDKSKCTEID